MRNTTENGTYEVSHQLTMRMSFLYFQIDLEEGHIHLIQGALSTLIALSQVSFLQGTISNGCKLKGCHDGAPLECWRKHVASLLSFRGLRSGFGDFFLS